MKAAGCSQLCWTIAGSPDMRCALLAVHLPAWTVFSVCLPCANFLQTFWVASSGVRTWRTSFCEEVKGSLSSRESRGQSQTPLTVFLSYRGVERTREGSWGQLGPSPRLQTFGRPWMGPRQRSGWKREGAGIWQGERFWSRWSFQAPQVWLLCLSTPRMFLLKERRALLVQK